MDKNREGVLYYNTYIYNNYANTDKLTGKKFSKLVLFSLFHIFLHVLEGTVRDSIWTEFSPYM